ncbi:Tat pathway signal protein [Acuticoccus sp. M5D2P5]|uniref:Acg family FMN-binding oxidoreductase n=1 Tax=Acuticoccus kalidii TaxID=2910977 RepID=UPI001F1978A1|nr:Tat pathway signal protein [Acuticoccus kalidii]MCF3935059.1 Tat pathway signal protein [Acuticoccus kalidii]
MKRRSLLIGAGAGAALAASGALWWRSATGSMATYDALTSRLRTPLPAEPTTAGLLRYATLAANGHNTQPWRFRVQPDEITIEPDYSRRTPVVDPDDHHLFVSLGCAAQNLALATAAAGLSSDVEVGANGSVRHRLAPGAPMRDPMFAAIPRRQTTRSLYDGKPVPPAMIDALRRAAEGPGVRVVILTDAAIDAVRDLVVEANTAQIADPAFVAELKTWLRFNPREAIAHADGLFAATTGTPPVPGPLGRALFDRLFTAANENDKHARAIRSSSGFAVFFAETESPAGWVAIGGACQRFALTATRLGLKQAFLNQPVEVPAFRPALAALAGEATLRPDLLMRFGSGPDRPYALRRPVTAVLD